MTITRGVGGINRTITSQTRGVSGVNRTISKQYRGVDGVNREVFSSGFTYEVYSAMETTEYSISSSRKGRIGGGTFYKSIDINKQTGSMTLTGEFTTCTAEEAFDNGYCYFKDGSDFYRLDWFRDDICCYLLTAVPTKVYSRGNFIKTIIDKSETAYPSNGRHIDGYWYVLKK